MNPPLELFVLTWGLYPRRILIYLAEKGLISSSLIKITPVEITQEGNLTAKGKPTGTVPVLRLPDGTFIKQSISILDYFEDICESPNPDQPWQAELAKLAGGSLRGRTAEEKARTRDMLSLADESTSQFGFACHKGTKPFVPMETTHALTAKLVMEYCQKNLKLLEKYYEEDRIGNTGQTNIADCVLYSTLNFAKELHSVDLTEDPDLPNLKRFYESFEKRDSVQVGKDHFPEMIKSLACQWLPLE